jgi:hypothetical protein
MKMTRITTYKNKDGVTLLITLLLMGVLLGISTALLNVTLKQYQLSGITFQSEIAFQAANAAMECAQYHQQPKTGNGIFFEAAVDAPARLAANAFNCFGVQNEADEVSKTLISSYDEDDIDSNEQRFEFSWGSNPEVCSEFSVYIFHEPLVGALDTDLEVRVDGVAKPLRGPCPEGSQCVAIKARGYNVPCDDIDDGGRVVEREFILAY